MRAIIPILLIIFSIESVKGQINYSEEESGVFQMGTIDSPFLRASQGSGNKIVGSIYLNENWEQAIIKDKNTSNTIKSLARFNAYHSEIEILKDEKINALLPSDELEVTLNNITFTPLKLENKSKPLFAAIIVDGKQSLYRVYNIKINKAPSDAKLLNLESTDNVVITYDLYLKNGDDKIIKVPSGKKDIKSILTDHMIDLAKKEKLSLKKENDLIELFKLTNSGK